MGVGWRGGLRAGKDRRPNPRGELRGAPGWLSWFGIQLLIWALVVLSRFLSSSPASGSAQSTQSLLGVLSAPPLLSLSLSLPKINKLKRERESCICLFFAICHLFHSALDGLHEAGPDHIGEGSSLLSILHQMLISQ